MIACHGFMTHSYDDASRPFCREFAHSADTVVIASDRVQTYNPGIYDSSSRTSYRALWFGAWKGNAFKFFPDGSVKDFAQCESPLP